MKMCVLVGLVAGFLTSAGYSEETIQQVDVSVGIDIGGGGDGYYEDEQPTFIWIGPGWYGGYWFGNEVEFNDWGHRHGWHHDHHGHHRGHHDHHDHHGGHHGHHGGHHH